MRGVRAVVPLWLRVCLRVVVAGCMHAKCVHAGAVHGRCRYVCRCGAGVCAVVAAIVSYGNCGAMSQATEPLVRLRLRDYKCAAAWVSSAIHANECEESHR